MPASDRVRIGTSGYSFKDWKGPFYPPSLAGSEMLPYYSRFFDIVEINATYYRIPPHSAFSRMVRNTDTGFNFIVKLHGSMTHERKGDPGPFDNFFDAISPLEESGRLDGLLAQFPWSFRFSEDNYSYLGWLARKMEGRPLYVEFRHESWVRDEVFTWLRENRVGYCIVDQPGLEGLSPTVLETTGPTAYVRLHGRNDIDWWRPRPGSDRYLYDYSDRELSGWAEKIDTLAAGSDRVLLFFNNCHHGNAPLNARKLKKILGLSDTRDSLPGELDLF